MFAYKQLVPRKSLQFSCTLFIRFWACEDNSSKIFSSCLLKGSLPRDFRLPVFSWIIVPRAISNFLENSRRYSEWKGITGVNNTRDKLFTGVLDSGDKRVKLWAIHFHIFLKAQSSFNTFRSFSTTVSSCFRIPPLVARSNQLSCSCQLAHLALVS